MSTYASKTGRTKATVEVGAEGDGLVVVYQDDHVIHRFDIPAEQRGPDGKPKSAA